MKRFREKIQVLVLEDDSLRPPGAAGGVKEQRLVVVGELCIGLDGVAAGGKIEIIRVRRLVPLADDDNYLTFGGSSPTALIGLAISTVVKTTDASESVMICLSSSPIIRKSIGTQITPAESAPRDISTNSGILGR